MAFVEGLGVGAGRSATSRRTSAAAVSVEPVPFFGEYSYRPSSSTFSRDSATGISTVAAADVDLYVKMDSAPTTTSYEVRGYRASAFTLTTADQ